MAEAMRSPHDLRWFTERLAAAGDLVTVERPVSVRFEVAAFLRRSADQEGPGFWFSRLKEYPDWTLCGGWYSLRRVAAALACPLGAVVERYRQAIRNPLPPEAATAVPCQAVVTRAAAVDLGALPVPVHSADDAGP